MARKQTTKAERCIAYSLRPRKLYSKIVDYCHARVGGLLRPSLRSAWKPETLLPAVESYFEARPEQRLFCAEDIASELRARVDMVRVALHKLNLAGVLSQRDGAMPRDNPFRSPGLPRPSGSSHAWQASYYSRRDKAEEAAHAEWMAGKREPRYTVEDTDAMVEMQAAGCEVVCWD